MGHNIEAVYEYIKEHGTITADKVIELVGGGRGVAWTTTHSLARSRIIEPEKATIRGGREFVEEWRLVED